MKSLFSATYTKPIATWYPYNTSVAATNFNSTATSTSLDQKAHWIIPVVVGVVIPAVGIICTTILWVLLKRKHHLQPGQCHCSPRKRHWLHKICPGSDRNLPGEVEGRPIESQTTRSVRVLSEGISELPAHCQRLSNDFSIAATPTQMYCEAYKPHEASGDNQILQPSGGVYELPSDGIKTSDGDNQASTGSENEGGKEKKRKEKFDHETLMT